MEYVFLYHKIMDMGNASDIIKVGRFAPSPSGRMHAGNVFTALISWLSVRKAGGRWILRIEDLDPQRSRQEYARLIEDDLHWLGLDWDEGGLSDAGAHGPYSQSERGELYEAALSRLMATGRVYGCGCTRADLRDTEAPHASDGRVIYSRKCKPEVMPCYEPVASGKSLRLWVDDESVTYVDGLYGERCVNLARECGDFVLRRADGAWSYQLAVVVDDALMGVNEVVRGNDLLDSAAQQIYLYRLLGYEPPRWMHLPLVCNGQGVRLSKRDGAADMGALRARMTARELVGYLAYMGGLLPEPIACEPRELIGEFDVSRLPRTRSIRLTI